MPLLVPLPGLASLFVYLRGVTRDWRLAILCTAVVTGTYTVLITEVFGAAHALTSSAITAAWLAFSIAACALLYLALRRGWIAEPSLTVSRFKIPDRQTAILVLGLGVLLSIVGVTAVVAPPNTSDAMDYHLPRVVEWMTYHSVQFFPTPDYQQLMQPPFAEYSLLQLALLAGSDQFVNLVEWLSYLGSIVAVSLIARQLGANVRGQLLAAICCATLPELVLESSGAMNTGVLAFWVATLVALLLAWGREQRPLFAVSAALAGGLALLTKGTAYMFLPPIVLACWWLGSKRARVRLLLLGPLLVVIGLTLNVPQYARNYQLTGSLLGVPIPADGRYLPFANDHVTVTGTLSNVLRNAALEFAVPSSKVNAFTVGAVSRVIRATGSDPSDPTTTWPDEHWGHGFELGWDIRSEVLTSNPFQFVLLLAIGGLIVLDRGRRLPATLPLLLGLVGAWVLFSALLRWQIYSSRQLIALLVVGSALVGLVLGRLPRRVHLPIISLLLVVGLVFAVENELRPVAPWPAPNIFSLSRSDRYFFDDHLSQAVPSIAAVEAVRGAGCGEVALDAGQELSVYPMMALLQRSGVEQVRFTGVNNRTVNYGDGSIASSCAVVCLQCGRSPAPDASYDALSWQRLPFGEIVVYLRPRDGVALMADGPRPAVT
jgi:hypothetical protein